ncbi:hypothetical protein EVA_09367 [gut metagenome]|uniref:Uncharacterized protein n=1 Tax=gut metagenome TaxID=749906 RepID=J9G5L9_9ZZZZ
MGKLVFGHGGLKGKGFLKSNVARQGAINEFIKVFYAYFL